MKRVSRCKRAAAHFLPAVKIAASFAVLLSPGVSRAGDPEPPPFEDARSLSPPQPTVAKRVAPPNEFDAFVYAKSHPPHYLRTSVEIFAVLGVGLTDYLLNTKARGGTVQPGDVLWDLRYDWPTFRRKLIGDNYYLDTNRINTNYISHPFAGTMYYTAARSNHVGVVGSLLFATLGSFTWEYFAEIREEVSVNDILVTPVAGMVAGETLLQIGSFFHRGRKGIVNDGLSALFAPVKAINDWTDGAEPLRSQDLDDLGFTKDVWHKFEIFLGGGVTYQRGGPRTTFADRRLGVDMQIANLPDYDGSGEHSAMFQEGNTAELRFELAYGEGELVDPLFRAEMTPAGYYWRQAKLDAAGRVRGQGVLVALRGAYEYGLHDYDRGRAHRADMISIVSPLGVTAEYKYDAGNVGVRTRLQLGAEIAGVRAYALQEYRRTHGLENLQTVLKDEGYYHAFGVSLVPSIDLRLGGLELRGEMRSDTFWGIPGLDKNQDDIKQEVLMTDRRLSISVAGAYALFCKRLVLSATGRELVRFGEIGDVRASSRELSLLGTVGLRL